MYPPRNRGLPFGPHPHRGFETVTFIVDGSLAHHDSGGHSSVIDAGGVQWMTAGRGLEHAELSPEEFKKRGGPLELLQLWVNLPARLKMTDPRYQGLQKDAIPAIPIDGGATVNLISGTWDGKKGPIESITGLTMTTVAIPAGARASLPAPYDETVFLYVVRGTIRVAGETAREFHLIELNDDGDTVEVEGVNEALILFGHGKPFGETVVAHGPFVMNTREEIVQAIRDFSNDER